MCRCQSPWTWTQFVAFWIQSKPVSFQPMSRCVEKTNSPKLNRSCSGQGLPRLKRRLSNSASAHQNTFKGMASCCRASPESLSSSVFVGGFSVQVLPGAKRRTLRLPIHATLNHRATVRSTPVHSQARRSSPLRASAEFSKAAQCHGQSWSGTHLQAWRQAMPNPSLKRRAIGRPPGPRGRTVYHRPRGPGVLPLSPA